MNIKSCITKIIVVMFMLICLVPFLCHGFEITIDVAPNVINLQSEAPVVTVHTDIAFNAVDCSTVMLNGVSRDYCKSDDRGYFVGKFEMNDMAALDLVIDDFNTFALTGLTHDGQDFIGEQAILVIDIVPVGKGK